MRMASKDCLNSLSLVTKQDIYLRDSLPQDSRWAALAGVKLDTYYRWFGHLQRSLPMSLAVPNGNCLIAPGSQVLYRLSSPPNCGGPPLKPTPGQSVQLQLVQYRSTR